MFFFFQCCKKLKSSRKILAKFIGETIESKLIRPCTKMNVTNGEWFQSCCRIVAPYICQKDPQPNISYVNKTPVIFISFKHYKYIKRKFFVIVTRKINIDIL